MKVLSFDELQKERQSEVKSEMTFPVGLPSKGRHGYADVIYCRPLKVRDVKALVRAVGDVRGDLEYLAKLVGVIQDTIIEPQVKVEEMSLQDFLKVLVAHRVNSIGSFIDIAFDCNACGKSGQVVKVDLVSLDERELGDEYGRDPVQVGKFLVRYPRMSAFIGRKGSLDEVTDFDLVEDMLKPAGVGVDDLDLKEYRVLLDWVRKWYGSYGVQTAMKVKCAGCGKEMEVGIPFLFFLFTG